MGDLLNNYQFFKKANLRLLKITSIQKSKLVYTKNKIRKKKFYF